METIFYIVPALISCLSPDIGSVCLCIGFWRHRSTVFLRVCLNSETLSSTVLLPDLLGMSYKSKWQSLQDCVWGSQTSLSFFVTLSLPLSFCDIFPHGEPRPLVFNWSLLGQLVSQAALCHLTPHLFLVQLSVRDFPLAEQRTRY